MMIVNYLLMLMIVKRSQRWENLELYGYYHKWNIIVIRNNDIFSPLGFIFICWRDDNWQVINAID